MKRVIYLIAIVLTASLLLSSLVGCALLEKKMAFSCEELAFNLDLGYFKVDASDKGYDAAYTSARSKLMLFLMRETFEDLKDTVMSKNDSVYKYAEEVYKILEDADAVLNQDDRENPYIEFEEEINDEKYTYRIYFKKTDVAFWRIQFAAPSENWSSYLADVEDILTSINVLE